MSTSRALQAARRNLLVRMGQRVNHFLSNHSFRGSSRIGSLVTGLLIGSPKGPAIHPTRYGFRLLVDPSSAETLDRDIFLKGTYEAGTIEVMRRCLRPGDVFLDVGGHIGLMSLAASRFVGDSGIVCSFEPEPTTFGILQQNIRMNGASNIRPFNVALGSARGEAVIYTDRLRRGTSSLMRRGPDSCAGTVVAVETLDDLLSSGAIPITEAGIRMIKIDVEGLELEVLKGGRRLFSSPKAPIICLEFSTYDSSQGRDPFETYNLIVSINDYRVYRLEKTKERPSRLLTVSSRRDLPRHDNLFCFRPHHLRTLPRATFRDPEKRETIARHV